MRRALLTLATLAMASSSAARADAAVEVSFVVDPVPTTGYSTGYFEVSGTDRSDVIEASYDGQRRFALSSDRAIATAGYCHRVAPTRARCLVPRGAPYGVDIALFGGSGNDQISFNQRGDDEVPYLEGGDDADLLVSGSGPDILGGGAGRDVLMSQGGPDFVRGGPGADDLHCGAGRDEFRNGPRDRVSRSCEDRV